MGTKFNLCTNAIKAHRIAGAANKTLTETIQKLYDGDKQATIACLEGVVDILGTLNARISAKQPILADANDSRKQRVLMGILAGAKTLMDHPEAAEAHNLTPNRLRQVIQQADMSTEAAQAMIAIARSAPTVVSEIVQMVHTYNAALESGDEAVIEQTKNAFQKMWLFWQRNASQAVDTIA